MLQGDLHKQTWFFATLFVVRTLCAYIITVTYTDRTVIHLLKLYNSITTVY